MRKNILLGFFLILLCVNNVFGQEEEKPSYFFLSVGYNFMRLGELTIHRPVVGTGFMFGEQDIPLNEVERRFFASVFYRPFYFSEEPLAGMPQQFHQIDVIFDGRINRHQLFFNFKSAADKPLVGGAETFQIGIGWGYELVRREQISLILGASLPVPLYDPLAMLIIPTLWPVLIRADVDTQWFAGSFKFHAGPKLALSFTVAPRSRIRFIGNINLDYFREIRDFTLWYRFFNSNNHLKDFAGIGIGAKSERNNFAVNNEPERFRSDISSFFAVVDISFLRIEGGLIDFGLFDINYRDDRELGRGFYISILGTFPFVKR